MRPSRRSASWYLHSPMRQSLFPSVSTLAEYEKIRHEDERFLPGALMIRDQLGLGALTLERFADGSLPVFALGESHVLKLYPPFERRERDIEAAALRATEHRLPIPTPELHAVGSFADWGYILMSRLHGRSLEEAWPEMAAEDHLRLMSELGPALAALHAIRGPMLDPLRHSWPAFLDEQRRTAVARQRERGLDEEWCGQIDGFLNRTSLGDAPAESLLHTEIMRNHLLVDRGPRGWRITGLFDFEPAMVGDVEYEFVAAGLFVTGGEPALFRRLLLAYGYTDTQVEAEFTLRLMAYGLLHRYSNVKWFLQRMPPPEGATRLEELARRWWEVA